METLVPTTRHRRGRRTPRQVRALADPGPALLTLDSITADPIIASDAPLVLDVGFGSGEAVVALAESDPQAAIMAVDMHAPGIGDLLASIRERDLGNIRVLDSDVRHVIPRLPEQRLDGVRTFFPDPWPKTRHHRRRLITTDFADALAERVRPGGFWHVATDWPDYAAVIEEQVNASHSWTGGRITRPRTRPITRYERRGLDAGRAAIDLWFVT